MFAKKSSRLVAFMLVLAMAFTLGAGAVGQPQTTADIVHSWVAEDQRYHIDVYEDLGTAQQLGGCLAIYLRVPGLAVIVATEIFRRVTPADIKKYGVNFHVLKTIETRQKPGDISPVYTTTYRVTYYLTSTSTSPLSVQTYTYTGMNPYSLDGELK